MEHDSLEEYLKLSEEISKGTNKVKHIVTTAQKRREGERKALGIVHLFLERSICPDVFLKSLVYLNPSYYEDVAEERALLQLCGYPLCRKKILKPKNRYSICIKSKKVYDLDEYGNYCSIFCFDANNHIKAQIPDSPLWLRDLETISTISLLVKKESYAAGIDIKCKKPQKSEEFTPISSFAELSLGDVGDIDFSVPVKNDKQVRSSTKKCNNSKLSTVEENDVEENLNAEPKKKESNHREYMENEKQLGSEDVGTKMAEPEETRGLKDHISCSGFEDSNKSNKNSRNNCVRKMKNLSSEKNCKNAPQMKDLKSITDKIKKKNNKPLISMIDPLPLKTKTSDVLKLQENRHEKQSEVMKNKSLIELKFSFKDSGSSIENSIKNIFRSWLSLETLMFVHGEDTIKKTLDVNKLSEHFERLKVSQMETDKQHKYLSICKRLCEQEVFEEKIDTLLVKNKLQPLPDYRQLKQESKEFNVKVSTFFSGDLHESDDKNFGTVEEKQLDDDKESTFVPLDDVNSKNTLRQQILLKTLKNSVEFFLDYLEYDSTPVLTELTELVKSFKLNSENIVFKLIIRNYLGLICLKILSLKDARLCKALEKSEFQELENSVFKQLPGKKEVLIDCLNLINNVNDFIETYVKSTDG